MSITALLVTPIFLPTIDVDAGDAVPQWGHRRVGCKRVVKLVAQPLDFGVAQHTEDSGRSSVPASR
jgi:hypothetical protein